MIAKGLKWITGIFSRERRRTSRVARPAMVANYWDGGKSAPRTVRDVSQTGLFVLTDDVRWSPGTLVLVSLLRIEKEEDSVDSFTVVAKVVRSEKDGMAMEFIPEKAEKGKNTGEIHSDAKSLKRFILGIMKDSGQSLVEMALVLPLIFILILNMINFAGFFYAWITVANAARAGADYVVLAGAAAGAPKQATGAQVATVVEADAASLPNSSSLVVNVCENNGTTVTTMNGTCGTVPADPESNYLLSSVEVQYTYQPFFPASFQFPKFNLYLTLPPTTIDRTALMRVLQ